MRLCYLLVTVALLSACATTNDPVLPPTADAHTGGADAALFAAKTY